ncbi:protein-export chaperone SecB [Sphingomonas sp. LHG3406-1]|uniref:protein-export chaperone SecB n=1 Tax=Sphingomonas sp. LHG3406-1 TaxID=2804617 RepID=UPI002609DBE8|nr:protein-export chaperone SecB [Sphingomonas sp. LHG3406-1]
MAASDPVSAGANGATDSSNPEAPQVAALAQYVKDLSVENPSSPQVYQWNEQPQLDVQFNISVNKIADDVHEVVLKIDASARSASGVQFVLDLSYAGIFGLRNLPEEALPAFLLVEAPRLLFPFARQVVASSVQDAGFPPLMLDPIDFAGIYMSQIEQQAQAEGGEQPQSEPTVQ